MEILKQILKKLNWIHLGRTGPHEHGYEPLGSRKSKEFNFLSNDWTSRRIMLHEAH